MKRNIIIALALLLALAIIPSGAEAWYSSFGFRTQTITNSTSTIIYSVNDTGGINGSIIWTAPYITGNQSYIYATGTGLQTPIAIANDTTQDMWENETTRTGNNVTGLWNQSGVMGVWHLGENTGTWANDSAGYNNLNLSNSSQPSTWVNGKFGKALNFTTACAYPCAYAQKSLSTSTNIPTGNAPITLSIWAKTAQSTASAGVFGRGNFVTGNKALVLMYQASGTIHLNSYNYDVAGTAGSNDNNWHYLVGTFDGTNMRLYVDKVLKGTTAATLAGDTSGVRLGNAYYDAFVGVVDEPRIYNYAMTEAEINATYNMGINNFSRLGTEQTNSGVVPIISISAPTNTTYLSSFNFTFQFSATPATQIRAYLDSVINYTNTSYINASVISFTRNLSLGQHNFSIIANNSGNLAQTDVIFTIKDFNVTGTTYEPLPYETTPYNFSLFIQTNFDVIQNITASMAWNGTAYTPEYQYQNSTHIWFTKQFTIPLVQANATQINHAWTYNISYVNGSNSVTTTANAQQNISFAYYLINPSNIQSVNQLIEREDFTNTFTVTAIKSYATLTANTTYNGTVYAMTSSAYNIFTKTIDSGNVSDGINNDTFFTFANLTVTFGGNSRVMNSEVDNITAYKIILTNCTGASTTNALNLSLLDEENSSAVTGTIDITNNVYKTGELTRIYSFTFSSVTGANICIYPAWAQYTTSSMLQYYAPGYSSRTYFIDANISNVSQSANLYLLSSANSYSTLFFLRDEYNNPYPGAIIQVQRYFTGTNTFKTVAQCKSDYPTGKCSTYMRILDIYYRYIISMNQTVIKTTTPSTIVCTSFESITFCPPYPIPLSISTLQTPNYFDRIGKVSVSVTVNNATNILSATVVDTSGTMTAASLNVEKQGALEFASICNSTGSSSALTFTCDLGNRTGNIYQYDLTGLFEGENVTLSSSVLDYRTGSMDWGDYGPILAFLVIGTLFFLGKHHPVAAIGYMCIGLAVAFLLNMTPLASGITTLIGIIVVFAIIAWRLK